VYNTIPEEEHFSIVVAIFIFYTHTQDVWFLYKKKRRKKAFYFFPSGHGNESCNLIGSGHGHSNACVSFFFCEFFFVCELGKK